MKEIVNVIDLTEHIDLHIKVEVDDEEIINKKSDSLLYNYLNLLRSFMGGVAVDTAYGPRSSGFAIDQNLKFIDDIVNVGGNYEVLATSHNLVTGNVVQIMGANDGTAEGDNPVNGMCTVVKLTDHRFQPQRNGSPISVTVGHNPNFSQAMHRLMGFSNSKRVLASSFSNSAIRVGRSAIPNEINDFVLRNEIPAGSFNKGSLALTGSVSIDEPSVGPTNSDIELRRDFTNNSDITINVREIGLYVGGIEDGSIRVFSLLGRDVVTPFPVLVGQKLRVTYNIITDSDSNSGMLIQLNEMLYRHLKVANREAKDIRNQNIVINQKSGTFLLISPGGPNFHHASHQTVSERGEVQGPQVGTSTYQVVNTNFRLQNAIAEDTRIVHGFGANQLIIYGAVISDITLDVPGKNCFFTIERIFENVSGGDITINESGLYAGVWDNYMQNSHCVARNRISPAVVIANGDFFKLTYKFTLTV